MIYDGYAIIDIEEFTPVKYDLLGRSNKKNRIYDCISVLDVETSHNHNEDDLQGWIYQWAWLLNDVIVVGRTKEQILQLMQKLYALNNEGQIRTFIHNLPYEFSYLWAEWIDNFNLKDDIMASSPHKPFRVSLDGFEFLCSYKVSNRSLSAWGKYYNISHKKLDNAIDYDAIHYPDTELTDTDWLYMYHDVISVKECLIELMKQECMRYDQLLMTSTMYVKNEVTKKYRENKQNFRDFQKTELSPNAYNILRKSFVGGITHANWSILNTTVRGNIAHYDFNSHYPTQMITKLFPVTQVTRFSRKGADPDIHYFLPNNKYAYWCEVDFLNLRLKDSEVITMPYISASKCYGLEHCEYVKDNGRLVECKGACKLHLSSYDIKWILKQYTCDSYEVIESYRSKLGKLPDYLTDTIKECYLKKCALKIKIKEMEKNEQTDTDEYREITVEYNKSKNILNGLYGVCATDPIRDEIEFNMGDWSTTDTHTDLESVKEKLHKYYHNFNRWTRYEWGTWVTSLARDELMSCIEIVGYDNFLYCDTDSIFFKSNNENLQGIEELNKQWFEDSKANNYSVTDGVNVWYMHSFESEEPLQAFRTLGAKCYAFETTQGDFDCTIAGVPSRKTVLINNEQVTYTRKEELYNIDNLDIGFNFTKCVPTRAVYTQDACIILNSRHVISVAESNARDYYFEEHTDI